MPFNFRHGNTLLKHCTALGLSLLIAACSNDKAEHSANSSGQGDHTLIQGNAVKGVIANGIVTLFYENGSGERVVLSTTRTDALGNFSLSVPEQNFEGVQLVAITADAASTMRCDLTMGCSDAGRTVAFGGLLPLPENFSMLGSINPLTGEAYVSPLSHLIILTAQQNPEPLSYETLELASTQVQQNFQLSEDPLLTRTPDLTRLAQEEALSEAQLKQALISAALFDVTLSNEWAENSVALDTLPVADVVLTTSVIAAQLLDLTALNDTGYVSYVANISEETAAYYQELAYEAPTIRSNPSSLILTEGDTGSFNVVAGGTGPFQYQWFKDNAAINGATSASLSFNSASLTDTGVYFVEVSDSQHSVRSLTAVLDVQEPGTPLSITSHPGPQSVMVGGTARFEVSANGTAPLTFQWRRNTIAISGATSSSLILNNVQLTDSGARFDVRVGNATGQIYSSSATLQVSTAPVPATITTQPQSQTLTEGQSLLLQVYATGDSPIRYQWVRGGAIIPGATSSSYQIASVNTSHSGEYYVTVENNSNTQPQRSNTASVLVTEAIAPVAITSHPQDLTVAVGDSANFSVTASGGGYLTYQWIKTDCNAGTGTLINSANNRTLALNNVQMTDAGAYCVRVANGTAPAANSNLATLTVLPNEIPVSILTQPLGQSIYVGESFTLAVAATGGQRLAYQWFKDNNSTPIYTGSSVFSKTNAQFVDAGAYRVRVSNLEGESSATSNEVIVRVNDRPSLLLTWGRPLTRTDGSELSASEIQGYVIEYGYQANNYSSSVPISGADTLSYELGSLRSGTIYVRIATVDSNGLNSPFSAPLIIPIP